MATGNGDHTKKPNKQDDDEDKKKDDFCEDFEFLTIDDGKKIHIGEDIEVNHCCFHGYGIPRIAEAKRKTRIMHINKIEDCQIGNKIKINPEPKKSKKKLDNDNNNNSNKSRHTKSEASGASAYIPDSRLTDDLFSVLTFNVKGSESHLALELYDEKLWNDFKRMHNGNEQTALNNLLKKWRADPESGASQPRLVEIVREIGEKEAAESIDIYSNP